MSSVRSADLAGTWYPRSGAECTRFLDAVPEPSVELPSRLFGAICPHAGWEHSGALAEQALRALARARPDPDLIIVFGGHLERRDLPRIFLEGAFATPLGTLEVATRLAEDASMAIESELETPDDYFDDSAVEVLMPIIKRHWPEVEVFTLGVPPREDAGDLGAEIVHLAGRRRYRSPVVIGSTDLTHYGPDHRYVPQGRGRRGLEWVTTKNDPELMAEIEALDAARVLWVAERMRSACSPGAVAAALAAAGKLGASRGVRVGHTTSYRPDSGEEPSSFVGYGALVLGA